MSSMPSHQRGASLVEVLVAFLLLSLTVVGASRIQAELRATGDAARQRSEAVQLAQRQMEMARGQAGVGLAAHAEAVVASTTHYALTRDSTTAVDTNLQTTTVQARWTDRAGGERRVSLASGVTDQSPLYAAALTLRPGLDVVTHPLARHRAIPRGAKNLGDGRSVFKPEARGTLALVFDHASGDVIASCRVDADVSTQALTAAHLGDCDRIRGSLLSGHVRFALGAAGASGIDSPQRDATPMPFTMHLDLRTPFTAPARCANEAMRTVRLTHAGRTRTLAVPLDSTAEDHGADRLDDTGERFATFTCLIVDARWSGQLRVEPQGWSFGTTAGQFKLCRLGTTPAAYRDDQGALRQQNFVVIRGDAPCPAADAASPSHNGDPAALAQHQP